MKWYVCIQWGITWPLKEDRHEALYVIRLFLYEMPRTDESIRKKYISVCLGPAAEGWLGEVRLRKMEVTACSWD